MNAKVLIEALQRACEQADVEPEDVDVKIATQPSWPFEHDISEYTDIKVADGRDGIEILCDSDGWYIADAEGEMVIDQTFANADIAANALDEHIGEQPKVIYLAEDGDHQYLSHAGRKALGW